MHSAVSRVRWKRARAESNNPDQSSDSLGKLTFRTIQFREQRVTGRLAQTLLISVSYRGNAMKRTNKIPPRKLAEWIEFYWLLLSNPTFQAARDKRKAYFEHRLAKVYNMPFC
jgi:hypothetical protein